jgi:uncharacterized membrane protein SirB2
MLVLGVKVYIVYCYIIFGFIMLQKVENDEIRWQVVKAMLEEFPTLKEKVKAYIEEKTKTEIV